MTNATTNLNENDELLKSRYEDFKKILTFSEVTSIKRLFHGKLSDYLKAKEQFKLFHSDYSTEAKQKTYKKVYSDIAKFNETGLDRRTIQLIFGHYKGTTRYISTKEYLPLITPLRDRNTGKYKVAGQWHSFTCHYSIGKVALTAIFNDPALLEEVLNANSTYYTKRQRKMIYSLILKQKNKPEAKRQAQETKETHIEENIDMANTQHPDNDIPEYNEPDEVRELRSKVIACVTKDVRKELLSLETANRISAELQLGIEFTMRDQPHGFSVSNRSINVLNAYTKKMPELKSRLHITD